MEHGLNFEKLDDLFSKQSYLHGFVPTQEDINLLSTLEKQKISIGKLESYPHLKRWFLHIDSFGDSDYVCWPHNDNRLSQTCEGLEKLHLKAVNYADMAPLTLSSADDFQREILNILATNSVQKSANSLQLAQKFACDHQKIVGVVKSLLSLGEVIKAEQVSTKSWELTKEGEEIANKGSHEAVLYYSVPKNDGILQSELMKLANAKIGFSKALQAGWIEIDKKSAGPPRILRKVDGIDDKVQKSLLEIRKGEQKETISEKERAEFKKRKLLIEVTTKSYEISKGPNFTTEICKPETDITAEMIANGSWREKSFKEYNFNALGVPPASGHLHPLLKVRSEFRRIFFEMGFTEMPTNKYVESCFWNFDALFQPQMHPARDAHDTFFVSDPEKTVNFPLHYLERVKEVHEKGGYGSQGYNYDWKIGEAQKNVLRTHTTAISARMLYELAKEKPFKPAKLFSIDRVFRNESLDATHLAEFHQVEGVCAEKGLTLGHMIGIMYEFFSKMGIEKLRFKPTYNPYTEPSMEVFAYHDGMQKWVEIGNSGLFRPEMLRPMGIPEDVGVLGWGLSLERPTMIRYGFKNIRDLVGPRVDLKMVYDDPICRLEQFSATRQRRHSWNKRYSTTD